jgi:hypothetical protein
MNTECRRELDPNDPRSFPVVDLILQSVENIFGGTAYIMYATVREKNFGVLKKISDIEVLYPIIY